MNIKNENEIDENLIKCNNCSLSAITSTHTKLLHSLTCNHRLCESCYSKIYIRPSINEQCKICNIPHEQRDYSLKSKEDLYYHNDRQMREKVLNV